MNLPNKLTLLRVLLIPIYMYFFLSGMEYGIYIAAAVFIAATLTDTLDGYLARRNNQVTTLGKLMDPIADKLLVVAALLCFMAQGVKYINAWVVIIIIAREFIVTGVRLVALGENKVIAASNWGKAKTVSQFITIILIMADMVWAMKIGELDIVFFFVALMLILTVVSGVDYIVKNRNMISFK